LPKKCRTRLIRYAGNYFQQAYDLGKIYELMHCTKQLPEFILTPTQLKIQVSPVLEFLIITLIILACLPFIPWPKFGKKKSLLDQPLHALTTQAAPLDTEIERKNTGIDRNIS
jgi:hypothetical protein